jgi:Putative lumazine-binding
LIKMNELCARLQESRLLAKHRWDMVMDGHQAGIIQTDEAGRTRSVALDYIGGVLHCDPARMGRALHPGFAKRAYLPGKDGRPQLREMSARELNGVVNPEVCEPDPDQQH